MKILSILSGGLDSTIALGFLKTSHSLSHAVNFQYGSKHNDNERVAVKKICDFYKIELEIIDLDFINKHFQSDLLKSGQSIPEGHYNDESMKRTVVPFRNGIMLSIAAGLAESKDLGAIVLGNHFGDHAIYPDCRKNFIVPMKAAIQKGTYKQIKILTPFLKMTKKDIFKIGHDLKAPLEHTWSCYKGGQKHCGKCGACQERREGFILANLKDPTIYET